MTSFFDSSRPSLFDKHEIKKISPLQYVVKSRGKKAIIGETTEANYGSLLPVAKANFSLDFGLLAATNFGLRTYFFDKAQNIVTEYGTHNSAFYSVAFDKNNQLIAISAPGLYKVWIYKLGSYNVINSIDGYAVTALEFSSDGQLFMAGYPQNYSWDQSAIYRVNIKSQKVYKITQNTLADVRGFAFHKQYLLISNGYHDEILFFDLIQKKVKLKLKGFNYPNGISITSRNTLLVADEHNDAVREISLETLSELKSTPFALVRSPGYVVEISQGKFKNHWLIADTDNNRVILVNANSFKIVAEYANLRGTLKAIPIFLD